MLGHTEACRGDYEKDELNATKAHTKIWAVAPAGKRETGGAKPHDYGRIAEHAQGSIVLGI